MSRYGGAVDSNVRRGQQNGVQHHGGHDGVQELIWGICVRLLFLLMPVCMGLQNTSFFQYIICT